MSENKLVKVIENEYLIHKVIEEVRRIQNLAKAQTDCPKDRLDFYVDYLRKNYKYDADNVREFSKYMHTRWNEGFKYAENFNMSKFFIHKTGVCQQYAIALAMLCYNDPEIECYQLLMEQKRIDEKILNKVTRTKHSANFIRIPKLGIEGVYDPVNKISFPEFMSFDLYKDKKERLEDSFKFLGMGYYKPGLHLEAIYQVMQTFGMGIKFDFEGYFSKRKTFLQSYDQDRLTKVIGYQIDREKNFLSKNCCDCDNNLNNEGQNELEKLCSDLLIRR